MYQKREIFFENVENFFDLVLIEEQMLQQKNGGYKSFLRKKNVSNSKLSELILLIYNLIKVQTFDTN